MKSVSIFLIHFFCTVNLAAQDTSTVETPSYTDDIFTDAALSFQLAIASDHMQSAIKNKMGNKGFGASILLAANPLRWGDNNKNFPVRVGVELGYSYFGMFVSKVSINGFNGDYKTSFGIANLNSLIRFRPSGQRRFTPFVDAIAGGNFYLSRTTENLNLIETALGVEKTELGSTANVSFNRGIGLGFSAGSNKSDGLRVTLRATYNRGKSMKYVVRNSLGYDANTNRLTFERRRAPVEYFLIQVGISK